MDVLRPKEKFYRKTFFKKKLTFSKVYGIIYIQNKNKRKEMNKMYNKVEYEGSIINKEEHSYDDFECILIYDNDYNLCYICELIPNTDNKICILINEIYGKKREIYCCDDDFSMLWEDFLVDIYGCPSDYHIKYLKSKNYTVREHYTFFDT